MTAAVDGTDTHLIPGGRFSSNAAAKTELPGTITTWAKCVQHRMPSTAVVVASQHALGARDLETLEKRRNLD